MSVTLGDLLAEPSLKLSLVVRGDPGALDAPIVWVHSSESIDPTPYLEGGEMLLVTGLQWPEELPKESSGAGQSAVASQAQMALQLDDVSGDAAQSNEAQSGKSQSEIPQLATQQPTQEQSTQQQSTQPTEAPQPAALQSFDKQPLVALRHYASRLADAGVRGIGFGIGVAHAAIPQWLVDQCEQVHLPLLSVPLETPFIAISKRVARGVSDGRRQEFAKLYHSQQQLIRSTRQIDPVRGIVTKTAQLVGGWAAFLNPAGSVRESSHHFLPVDVNGLSDALTFSKLGEAKFFQARGYDIAVLHVASPDHITLGYLVAGCKGEKGALDQTLCAEAATLLALSAGGSSRGIRALTHFRSAMTRDCLEGRSDTVVRYADDLWGGMPREPLEVLRIMGEDAAVEDAARLFEPFGSHIARATNPVVYGKLDDELWVVVSQGNAPEWLGQLAKDSRLTVGESSGCTWHDLARARHEAFQAGSQALASGAKSVRYGETGGAASLEAMVDPAAMRAFADLRLAPIANLVFDRSTGPRKEAAGSGGSGAVAGVGVGAGAGIGSGAAAAGGTGMVAGGAGMAGDDAVHAVDVVRAWVSCRGRVEEAARLLGVHRHTMTKYVARVGRVLHMEMSDPGVMAELWYACRYTRFGKKQ